MTEKVLGTFKDKKGADVVITHSTHIAYSPAISMFMKHHAELIARGWALPMFLATNKSQVVYATINGQVVGEIAFEVKDDTYIKFIQIYAGAVEQAFRGRGIYKLLHSKLEEVGKAVGCKKIRSEVHADNTPMIDTFSSLGKKTMFYRLEKDL